MLPREHRLKSERDIKLLFSKGKGVHHKLVGVKTRKNDQPSSRFVFVVSTKVHKRAWRRNRLRRRLREIVRTHLSHIEPGFDIALMAKKDALEAPFEQLEASALAALKKAKVLSKPIAL